MAKQNHLLIFLLGLSIFSNSCTKDKLRIGPPPAPILPPTPLTAVRNTINAQLVQAGNLSQARNNIAVASAGTQILFAGGSISPGVYSSRVDIYDISSGTWSTAELSQARSGIATAVLDKKIYFAGGFSATNSNSFSSRVDIYDSQTNTWTTANLRKVEALMAGASAGNKVVFASGATAHIYDALSGAWTTAPLSERPGEGYCCQEGVGGIAATVIGNNIYFAGGEGWDLHKAIDIYNTATNQWSTSSLSEYKGFAAGIAIGNTNYWAGGNSYFTRGYALSQQVEIRDMTSGLSTISNLFQGNAGFSAVQKNDTIIFFTGSGAEKNKFDIYDVKTKTWSIGLLPENIEGAAIISVNNTIYVAGGKVNGVLSNQVRKLEF
jgi:N-acetylneuraminic acid mutarotase